MSRHACFVWLDDHPGSYPVVLGLVLAAAAGLALHSWLRPRPTDGPRPDWRWGLVLLLVLLAGRWPGLLLPRELNPDESHVFAGTHALAHDPVFWRAIDGATSGPLNFFALMPAGWVFGWDSFPGIRLTALLLLAGCLTLVHQCLALVYPPRAVRLATLSAAAFEAVTNSVDLLHYSTELLSLLWLAGAGYAAGRRWLRAGGPGWSGLGGLLLGAVPMSKLQAAPLALASGAVWLWAEWRARGPGGGRHLVYLVVGAVLPLVLFVVPVLIAGHWDNFITSYFLFNFSYTATGTDSLLQLLRDVSAKSIEQDSLLGFWLPATLIWCALAFRVRPLPDRAARVTTWLAFGATVVAILCVLRAGRPFLHYWQLVVPPVTLLLGALLGNLAAAPVTRRWSDRSLIALCALVLLAGPYWHRVRNPNRLVGAFTYFERHPRNTVSARVLAHARPGETLAVWGWANYLYVETGLRQATQDAQIERAITPGPLQAFFRDRFLADLMVTRPALFVDAVGPCSLYFQSPALKHDRNYPELGAVIRTDYVLVDEVDGAQIYRRRDLPGR